MTIYVLIDDKLKLGGAKTYLEKNEKEFKKMNDDGWGVYFSVNDFDKERKTEKVTSIRYVYADMDIAKRGDGQSREQKQEKKQKLLKALLTYCEPTYIIDTSNGLQPLWELENKTVSEESKRQYVKVLKGIVAWSKTQGSAGDNVYDISRIVRLPGYYHHKEEPYLCEFIHKSKKKYALSELERIFPFSEKEYKPVTVDRTNLSLVDQAIDEIDFQELIIKAFKSTGRTASFDKQKRLVLDGRLTGTFQGKKDDGQFLASTSHEPYKGNKITAVADILSITNKEARKWILSEYHINYSNLKQTQKVEQLKSIPLKKDYKLRYTWGTRILDTSFAIIKRGHFVVAAAKSGSGKTTFVFDMACKNAVLGHKVLFLSLEMDEQDIKDDFGRKYAGITIEEEYDYKIPDRKQTAFQRKIDEINNIQNLTIKGIRRSGDIQWEDIETIVKENGETDLVFIDNLDLIGSQEKETDLDRQKRIVKSILNFTALTKIPIVLIHHYRKSMAGAKDKGLDEMSGSGKIRDGADRIIKITRNQDMLALYPEKYKSTIYLQKGRGYPEAIRDVYFIKGTFVDEAPPVEGSYQPSLEKSINIDDIEF